MGIGDNGYPRATGEDYSKYCSSSALNSSKYTGHSNVSGYYFLGLGQGYTY